MNRIKKWILERFNNQQTKIIPVTGQENRRSRRKKRAKK